MSNKRRERRKKKRDQSKIFTRKKERKKERDQSEIFTRKKERKSLHHTFLTDQEKKKDFVFLILQKKKYVRPTLTASSGVKENRN